MLVLEALIRTINAQHGRAFEVRGRYPTGEQGAFAITEIIGGQSQSFVLKWSPGTTPAELCRAATLTERLGGLDYPAPRYRLVGTAAELGVVYSVQEALPGMPLGDRLDGPVLDQLLVLNTLQCDRANTSAEDWPRAVVDPVLLGGDGFCLLDSLRTYSVSTAELLTILQRTAVGHGFAPGATSDIVHFDFQGANILINGDSVSGIIDWEGWHVGDAAFDLATLYFYTNPRLAANQAQRNRLWDLLISRIGTRLLGAYLAHLMLRQLDWSIRFHDRTAVEQWLSRCHDVLRQLTLAMDGDDQEGVSVS